MCMQGCMQGCMVGVKLETTIFGSVRLYFFLHPHPREEESPTGLTKERSMPQHLPSASPFLFQLRVPQLD